MSGHSWSWEYVKTTVSGLCLVAGAYLLLEHLYMFGGFDIEILGHEWYGLGLIIFAILIKIKWRQIKDIHSLRDLFDEGER